MNECGRPVGKRDRSREMASRRLSVFVSVLTCILLLSTYSCSKPKLGDPFKKIDTIPANKAVIYLYRPFADMPSIYNERIGVTMNGREIVSLPSAGYYPYMVDAGGVTLTTKFGIASTDAVTIDARAGQSYFIRINLRSGAIRPSAIITIVRSEVGEKQIGALNIVQDEK
jgi:hypothetical protein